MRILGVPVGALIKVGAFSAVSVVLTVLLAIQIGNLQLFSNTYTVEAAFTDATGVFEGDAVKLAGVDVGRVSGTRIEDGKAVVTFEVEEEVRLTDQSRVGIRWRNVLGLRFLYLFPGEGGKPLEPGDRIPVERTDTAGDIGKFLNQLGPILQAIDPEKANAFLQAMNTALAGNEATVRALFSEGAVLADQLGAMDEEIQSLLRSSDKIMAAYASQNRAIGQIIDDLDLLGGSLAGMTEDVNSLVTNFAVVQEELLRLQQDSRADIDAGLQSLSSVTATLAKNREAVERLLCSAPRGVVPYALTTSWGEWFNVRIVEFVVKDREGNIIANAKEDSTARADEAPPTIVCPEGAPVEALGNADPTKPRSAQASAQQRNGGLDAWLSTVVGGGGGQREGS